MTRAYYNENDAYAAQWLRNLIAAGHLPAGDVDERSIVDVAPSDLAGYAQCHFFAGIGGWALAARLAGWPDDRELWTGSCPCQPFSAAGPKTGFSDDRHLWPEFKRLIAERRPAAIFGEQSAKAHEWLALVRSDLEALGYAVGAEPVEAACVGADQLRDRYWFVADLDEQQPRQRWEKRSGELLRSGSNAENPAWPVVGTQGFGWGKGWTESELRCGGLSAAVASISGVQVIECPDGKWRRLPPPRVRWLGNGIPARVGRLRAYGNAIVPQVAAEVIGAYLDAEAERAA